MLINSHRKKINPKTTYLLILKSLVNIGYVGVKGAKNGHTELKYVIGNE